MLEPLARLGYASKAVIYAIVGSLAIAAAAFGRGGRVTDTSGALRVMLGGPAGRAVLVILAVGLCGYALWRVIDAIRDPDHLGTGFKALVTRIGNGVRAVVYGALGARGIQPVPGSWRILAARSAVVDGTRHGFFSARRPGCRDRRPGRRALRRRRRSLPLSAAATAANSTSRLLPPGCGRSPRRISRFGIGARGVIITVLGVFLVRAALQRDPSEAHGTRDSMLEIVDLADGVWILGFIGAGLLAYAFDQGLHARYRRIKPVL